jgi:hypothetical protein
MVSPKDSFSLSQSTSEACLATSQNNVRLRGEEICACSGMSNTSCAKDMVKRNLCFPGVKSSLNIRCSQDLRGT